MTTQRRWQVGGSAVLLVLAVFAAVQWRELQRKSQLRDQIVAALLDRDPAALLRAAPWQRLGVFGPYTSDKDISRTMRITSRLSESSGLHLTDYICLVVLVMKTGEVEDIVVPLKEYDLESINGGSLPLILEAGELREPAPW